MFRLPTLQKICSAALLLLVFAAASVQAQESITLAFHNRTANVVTVLWIDASGNEVEYAAVQPGFAHLQQTIVGHEWVVRGLDGEVLNRTTAREGGAIMIKPQGERPMPVPAPLPAPAAPVNPDGEPMPLPPVPNVPQTREPVGVQSESAMAVQRLNEIRRNPAQFAHLHQSLADADVEARPALKVNQALQAAAQRKAQWMADNERPDLSQVAHVINIDGQNVGMNQWMREAGYPLADYLQNDQTNFECLYMDGGVGTKGIGKRAIDTFMREGKNGGHVLPTLGRSFWKSCKDIGVGVATSPSGNTYVSVLVGVYDPFNPDNVP